LSAVTTAAAARAPGAPEISPEVPGNICFDWRTSAGAAVAAAFAGAANVVELDLDNHRIVTNPMEPRGVIGLWDAERGRYTGYVSSQSIHATRDNTARALGVPPSEVRFVAPDVGGGFGAKNFIYPEHVLILWAARRVGRPVKWIATRSEGFLSDHQARDHRAEAALALDADGRFLALRVDSVANAGAYLVSAGGVQTFQYVHLPGTVYRIPAIALQVSAVLTNTAPIGVTRGPGFAEAVNIIERLIDKAARQCGFDRAELRRINMVPLEAMPVTNAFGNTVDSGAFAQTFGRALAAADVEGFPGRRRESESRGLLRGLGFAYHIKGTGGSPHENVDIRFEAGGTVSLITGTQTIGQGHETTFPQILADRLGVPNERIRLVQGDTDRIPLGGGHGSSRATYMGGTAIWRFPNGAHVAEVEIDRDTGEVKLARYTAVDDYGALVNPMIAAGQAHGAIAQGVGQALFERAVYDPASGQPIAGSFMDYAMPRADDLPSFALSFNCTRCTTNPLGVKGCGEAGAIAAFPAIANAIADALAPFGATNLAGPATPPRIRNAIGR
jgi:carbon-monoxide dehydrogenase large subunit